MHALKFLGGLITFIFLSIGSVLAQTATTSADMSGTVHLYDKDKRDCLLTASGESGAAFNFDCDYHADTALVDRIPSGSTLLLSAKDCTTSTNASNWWVKLQATAKSTSTEELSIANIITQAARWKDDPSTDPYVAPYLKIIGAEIKNSNSRLFCALLQLPATEPASILRTIPKIWEPNKVDQYARCGDGILVAALHKEIAEFSYQCAELQDESGSIYKASNTIKLSIKRFSSSTCPADTVATGLSLGKRVLGQHYYQSGTLECSALIAPNGKALSVSSSHHINRPIHYKDHNSTCENNSHPGPKSLLTAANQFLVGVEIIKGETRWYCSDVTPGR